MTFHSEGLLFCVQLHNCSSFCKRSATLVAHAVQPEHLERMAASRMTAFRR